MTFDIDAIFGPRGYFAQHFPSYESRRGQIEMSALIQRAMSQNKHSICEAPCGTGKGVAYGVAAIWHINFGWQHPKFPAPADPKGRVIIVTENIALQRQLIDKDLPLLAAVLPWKFTYGLMKGQNNYLCNRKVWRIRDGLLDDRAPHLRGLNAAQLEEVKEILEWCNDTDREPSERASGDKEDLTFVPSPHAWGRLSVSQGECDGKDCPYYEDCYSAKSRRSVRMRNIIVTNYHLLFAHTAVKAITGGDFILPPFTHIVCDEAHKAPEIARNFYGYALTERGLRQLLGRARGIMDRNNPAWATAMSDTVKEFFSDIKDYANKYPDNIRLRVPQFVYGEDVLDCLYELEETCHSLLGELEYELEQEKVLGGDGAEIKLRIAEHRRILSTSLGFTDHIDDFVYQRTEETVYWIETSDRFPIRLEAKPIDAAAILARDLFAPYDSVSLVSATLATGGNFKFFADQAGVPKGILERIVSSPFDFKRQAILIIPEKELPNPNHESYPGVVTELINRVITLSGGSVLGLFTSYRILEAVKEGLQHNGHTLLTQGDAPRLELVDTFKRDESSILLGTKSFWTGIDVQGPSLSVVVIDKIPFKSPKDPIINAIEERLGKKMFRRYVLPNTIIELRQAVGRLIRSRTDVGAVVILDPRLVSSGYGNQIIRSLPDMPQSDDLNDITEILAREL